MALTDENGGMGTTMLVSPTNGFPVQGNGLGDGFGGSGWWFLLLFVLLGGFGGGWGNNAGGMNGGGLYPWMNQAEITSDGFRDQMMNNNITSIRDRIGDISTQLCNGFAGVNATVNNGFSQAEIAANGRQMANMQQAFAAQTAMSQGFNQLGSQFSDCCCENRLGLADLKYSVATENCADRTQSMQNTRDIIENANRNNQAILDKLCQLELDGVKNQLAQAQRENIGLQNQINIATFEKSQTAQNALFAQGLTNEVDALYNRLSNCPIPSTPVYGRTPIFSCGNNNGCGCGNSF